MDKFDKIMLAFVGFLVATMLFLLGWGLAEQQWKHKAIIHHSAFYEADSWGNVKFHWNDDSFAQAPLVDEGWEKVQASIFQKKLDALGIK